MMIHPQFRLTFSLSKYLFSLSICLLLSSAAIGKSFEAPQDTSNRKVQNLELLSLDTETDSLKQQDPPKKQLKKRLQRHRANRKMKLSIEPANVPTIKGFEELESRMPAHLRPFIVNDDIVMLLKDDRFWLATETIQSKNYIIYKPKVGGIKTPDHDM